jgi:hypothetical protein
MTDPGDPLAGVDPVDADGEVDDDTLAEEVREADERDLVDLTSTLEDTPFDETRQQYSGVADGDADVDVEEYAEAGALLDDPEDTVLLQGGIDDPDGSAG